MKKDFLPMETKGVWEVLLMSSMQSGRIVAEKDDGTLRSRTVAQSSTWQRLH
jgi:hypothetical protein